MKTHSLAKAVLLTNDQQHNKCKETTVRVR